MKEISKEELGKILKEHKEWLKDNTKGKKADLRGCVLIGVDLRDTDLRDTDLSGANLSGAKIIRAILNYADLRNANLTWADLTKADLTKANLTKANLTRADLTKADLGFADLTKADLTKANLTRADLTWANLYKADLSKSKLCNAYCYKSNLVYTNLTEADLNTTIFRKANMLNTNLTGADLTGADLTCINLSSTINDNIKVDFLTTGFSLACPEEGSFIGYKKVKNCIIKLEILADAKRSSATTRKCRCSKAKVISITKLDGSDSGLTEIYNSNHNGLLYKVGEIVEVEDFDDNRWNECSTGIHFFITRNEAVNY